MSSRLSPRLYADLVGKPFRAGARGPEAFDCVGLVLELQRRLGRDLGSFASTPAEFHRQFDGARGMFGPCRLVALAQPGSIALVRMTGGQMHVGTMLDAYTVLHTSAELGAAAIERVLSPAWQRRVLGFYVPEVTP